MHFFKKQCGWFAIVNIYIKKTYRNVSVCLFSSIQTSTTTTYILEGFAKHVIALQVCVSRNKLRSEAYTDVNCIK